MGKATKRAKSPRTIYEALKPLRAMVENRAARDLDSATPERLARAGDTLEIGADRVQRISDAPLDMLFKKKLLALRDHGGSSRESDLNAIRFEAGRRFRGDWHLSRMNALRSRDYRQPYSTPHAVGTPSHFATDRALDARKRYRAAVSALGSYFDEVVEAVVLHEVPLAIAGQRVYGGAAGAPAKAVALDRLREGLHLLATHYGLLDERKRNTG